MDSTLVNKLGQKSTLKTLQHHLLKRTKAVNARNQQNIFRLLCQHDSSIGYYSAGKVYVKETGWSKIIALVNQQVGINLISTDLDQLSLQDRVTNSGVMADEKALSVPPTQGYVMCRLLYKGLDDAQTAETNKLIHKATKSFTNQPTPESAYMGVHINQIMQWQIARLVVIENFAPFVSFTSSHLAQIEQFQLDDGIDEEGLTLLIYRGHDAMTVYDIADDLAGMTCDKYVFADYDLAGLQLADAIAQRITATGFILPKKPWANDKLVTYSKRAEREKQSHIVITSPVLKPYYNDIKSRFLAVTQEALLANGVGLGVVKKYDN